MGLSVKLNLCFIVSCLLTACLSAPELRGIRAEGNRLVNYRKEEINIKVRRMCKTSVFFLQIETSDYICALHIDNMTV